MRTLSLLLVAFVVWGIDSGINAQTYTHTVYYDDGSVKEEYSLTGADSVRNGPYRYYYPGGVLGQQLQYTDGKIDGQVTIYQQNGKKSVVCNYDMGLRHGLMKIYDEDGDIKEAVTFFYDKVFGPYYKYYKTGEMSFAVNRIGDFWEETAILFYQTGHPKAVLFYKHGKKNGSATYFFPDGTTRMNESNYVDDVRTGPYKAYYSNGNLAETGQYKDGNRDGYWVSFYPDGVTVYTTGYYVDNNFDGLWRIYNPDGTLKQEAVFQNSYEHGCIRYGYGQQVPYFMGSPLIER